MKRIFQIWSVMMVGYSLAFAAGDVPFPLCQDGNPEHCPTPAIEAWMSAGGLYRINVIQFEEEKHMTLENITSGNVELLYQTDRQDICANRNALNDRNFEFCVDQNSELWTSADRRRTVLVYGIDSYRVIMLVDSVSGSLDIFRPLELATPSP